MDSKNKTEIRTMAGLTFRPERDDDLDFLRGLYASTRSREMDLIDWSNEQKNLFLTSQFQTQRNFYLANFQDCRFDVIEQEGVAIGRFYVAHRSHEIRIIDIALLPEHRGRGLGGRILLALLDRAAADAKSVSLHVEKFNPALHLYERLGFKSIGEDNGINQMMEWRSEAAADDQLNTIS